MADYESKLWVQGDNSHGALGITDLKFKSSPVMNLCFEDKRIIDFSCGDGFTVVIAEVYQF